MRPFDLRSKSKLELKALLKEKRLRVNELRLLLHQRKIKNVREIVQARKDVARILTIAHNKNI